VTIPFGTSHLPPEQVNSGNDDASTSLRVETVVQEALQWLPEDFNDRSVGGIASPSSETVPSTLPGRVLVVDDNADMRAYLQSLLSKQWEVVGVADGLAALAAIKDQQPDLLVTDAMMPNLDGFGLLKAIRSDHHLHDIPVIMLSARAGEEARIEGLEAGADYYLTKPFSGRELIAQVNANLKVAQLRREATRQLERSSDDLSRRTAQYETLLSRAPLGVYVVDADFKIVEVNPTAMPVFGDKAVIGSDFGNTMRTLWLEDYASELISLFRHTLETGEPHIATERSEHRADRGQIEYYEWQIHRITMPDGRFGVVCYFRDISLTVRSRTQRELLINELNHRVKNTLTTIQSMTAQTLAGAGVDRRINEALEARLISMAGAHDILTQQNWSGADLREIVSRATLAFANHDRIRASGPAIKIMPSAALALAMALHELATNAVKYGALSGNGTVDIAWRVDKETETPCLNLEWRERGGPSVTPPKRQGFGSRLISRGLATQLNGKAELSYDAAGVVCRISAPVAKLTSLSSFEVVP
jgi:PAS domain S-box-containing protein